MILDLLESRIKEKALNCVERNCRILNGHFHFKLFFEQIKATESDTEMDQKLFQLLPNENSILQLFLFLSSLKMYKAKEKLLILFAKVYRSAQKIFILSAQKLAETDLLRTMALVTIHNKSQYSSLL